MSQNEEKYDIVVDINSIKKLKEGWEIKYFANQENIKTLKDKIRKSNKNFISVLGHSNRGKTYILQKICKEKLKPGYEITTKGISIKSYGENAFLLDTVGTNAPLLVEESDKDPRDEPDFYSKQLDEINLCQIITNYIVQTFVIKYADILLCIVGMLTSSEQQFLNKIKKNCSGKKKLFVIHNLIHCYERSEVEDYINNTLKKSIIHSFDEVKIPNFEGDENNFNKYFIETDNGEDHEFDILHFIMANDIDKNNQQLRFFNEPTTQFIRDQIDHSVMKDINLLESLVEHIKDISIQVLEKELNEIQIVQGANNNEKLICKEDIKAKEVTADELDNIYFVGKDYEPPFRYYKNEGKFVIEIQLCCDIDNLKIQQKFLKENEEFLFIITGQKKIMNNEETDDAIEIADLINKRFWKNFKIEFKIRIKDFEIDGLEQIDINDECVFMEYGILYINFNVE